eukprot:1158326-Pelagomonas_calceolata.AAC.2
MSASGTQMMTEMRVVYAYTEVLARVLVITLGVGLQASVGFLFVLSERRIPCAHALPVRVYVRACACVSKEQEHMYGRHSLRIPGGGESCCRDLKRDTSFYEKLGPSFLMNVCKKTGDA